MEVKVNCIMCGKTFTAKRSDAKCCSKHCKNERMKVTARERRKAMKNEKAEKQNNTLIETVSKARELGMSYGKYKAMLYMGVDKNGVHFS